MIRLALPDPPLASAIAERSEHEPAEVEELRVVCSAATREELLAAGLRERSSTIQCECPNHLADLMMRLQAFEACSKGCENRKDADSRTRSSSS